MFGSATFVEIFNNSNGNSNYNNSGVAINMSVNI
jgi:hypothetical protein